jgi:putative transposase
MTTENTIVKAWYAACKTRTINPRFVFHSDRGVQYASNSMTNLFAYNRKITQSMSRTAEHITNSKIENKNR